MKKKRAVPRWWVSWYQPPDPKHGWDHRPVRWPYPDALLGAWCSGTSDTHMVVCALVEADTELDARRVLALCWPEFPGGGERFLDRMEPRWTPGARFPMDGGGR